MNTGQDIIQNDLHFNEIDQSLISSLEQIGIRQ